jgi:FkbM family methyltransferase
VPEHLSGIPEPALEKVLRDAQDYWFAVYSPRPGDVIVDVGAGCGEDCYAFSHAVGPTGTVWAIEPHPDTFRRLSEFIERHGLSNVRAVRAACLDEPRDAQIETLPVWESNYVRGGPPTPTSHAVRGLRLDDLCAELSIDRIDLLKMNIEGAERWALPGAAKALRRARYAVVSAHDFRANRGEGDQFRTMDLVRAALLEAGYSLHTRNADPRYYVPYHIHGFREA